MLMCLDLCSKLLMYVAQNLPGLSISGITDDSRCYVGSGGCAARVINYWVPDAAQLLNSCIGTTNVAAAHSKADESWHPKVVEQAFLSQGYHFHKVDLSAVDLNNTLKDGEYLVDGVLNNTFSKMHKGREYRYDTDPDDTTTPYNNEANWRHSFAVCKGEIFEIRPGGFTMSTKWLWIGADNTPDRDKGYFYKIFEVYRIRVCKGKTGCKGECAI